jgi:hypothetical protein
MSEEKDLFVGGESTDKNNVNCSHTSSTIIRQWRRVLREMSGICEAVLCKY